MTRRNFLRQALVGAALVGEAQAFGNWSEWLKREYCKVKEYILLQKRELLIPKLASYRYEGEYKVFDMNIQRALHPFFEGEMTHTYGINASYLGETILLGVGEKVKINYSNFLSEPTTMHGHGMHVPAQMDGAVHQIIHPSSTWSAVFEVKQSPATNWYHPHLMGETARQVYQGLAGLILIEDKEHMLKLPNEYGVDDIPLVIQQRRFKNNQIDYSPSRMDMMRGYIGGELVVNGGINPVFKAKRKFLRLRILNGSNASMMQLQFDKIPKFYLIGGDNSFLPDAVPLSSIFLSPAERVEIVVDLDGLQNSSLRLLDQISAKEVLRIEVGSSLEENLFNPNDLTRLEDLSLASGQKVFRFGMRRMRFTINGKTMDKDRIDEFIPLDQPQEWVVENPTRMAHNFHVHATHFRVLERNGSSANVRAWERGYKDTVFLGPGDRVKLHIVMRDFADPSAPYMYHCHILEHEDNGMMGQFVVI